MADPFGGFKSALGQYDAAYARRLRDEEFRNSLQQQEIENRRYEDQETRQAKMDALTKEKWEEEKNRIRREERERARQEAGLAQYEKSTAGLDQETIKEDVEVVNPDYKPGTRPNMLTSIDDVRNRAILGQRERQSGSVLPDMDTLPTQVFPGTRATGGPPTLSQKIRRPLTEDEMLQRRLSSAVRAGRLDIAEKLGTVKEVMDKISPNDAAVYEEVGKAMDSVKDFGSEMQRNVGIRAALKRKRPDIAKQLSTFTPGRLGWQKSIYQPDGTYVGEAIFGEKGDFRVIEANRDTGSVTAPVLAMWAADDSNPERQKKAQTAMGLLVDLAGGQAGARIDAANQQPRPKQIAASAGLRKGAEVGATEEAQEPRKEREAAERAKKEQDEKDAKALEVVQKDWESLKTFLPELKQVRDFKKIQPAGIDKIKKAIATMVISQRLPKDRAIALIRVLESSGVNFDNASVTVQGAKP